LGAPRCQHRGLKARRPDVDATDRSSSA
jgi:hypothetical protein